MNRIDLSGPEGNAFYLMNLVQNWGGQLGLSQDEINSIITEMKSAGYDHLVKTFVKNFGVLVEIYKDGQPFDVTIENLDQ
uniref:Uncharacterized protein n=1 Tax=viral metagenome TaxID=1070528 RepID=A0A6C0JH30_9ZZZZ